MEKLANYLTNLCIREGVIKEDYEIYYYGFVKQLGFIFNAILIMIIGYWIGAFGESFIFLLVFGNIREYSGGYHANTEIPCTIFSVLTFVLCKGLSNVLGNSIIYLSIISLVLICAMAPVTNPNKPNTALTLKNAKQKTILLSVECFMLALIGQCLSLKCFEIIYSIIIFILLLMIVQIYKVRREKDEN